MFGSSPRSAPYHPPPTVPPAHTPPPAPALLQEEDDRAFERGVNISVASSPTGLSRGGPSAYGRGGEAAAEEPAETVRMTALQRHQAAQVKAFNH